MYRGVEVHTKPGADAPQSIPEFVAQDSIGTDFALRFGRTIFCTRLPMPAEMMTQVMDFLNGLNDEYWTGNADYHWSGYSDNCVHTLHNALAAAGVWKPKSIRGSKLRQLFNLAMPANTFIDLAFLSNRYPIEDFGKIRGDKLHWESLATRDWVPATPGVLLERLPVLQVNALYDTKFRMFSPRRLLQQRHDQARADAAHRRTLPAARRESSVFLPALRAHSRRARRGRELDRLLAGRRIPHRPRDLLRLHQSQQDTVIEVLERMAEIEIIRAEVLEEAKAELKERLLEPSSGP